MKKILYATGDSFVAGMECLGDGDRSPENKELAFPKHVAVNLSCEQYINNAYHGATNEFIFRRAILDLQELERNGTAPSEVFVIIGFTALHRIEVDGDRLLEGRYDLDGKPILPNNKSFRPTPPDEFFDHNTVFINPGQILFAKTQSGKVINVADDVYPFCTKYLWTNPVQRLSQEARVYALHTFLKLKGYKHVMVSTCSDEIMFHNDVNFFNPLGELKSFYEYALTFHPTDVKKQNHFGPTAHAGYAELLINHIRDNIL
jgi:hypothetical protein